MTRHITKKQQDQEPEDKELSSLDATVHEINNL
jgi:hypothetical protein